MGNGIEQTIPKITRPEAGGILPPERLFRKLDDGVKRPAIWVCGPGGAGKTHLLTSYIESRELSSIWYQIDRGDTDVAGFFYYLGIAGNKIKSEQMGSLPILTSDYSMGLSRFAYGFFEELFARMEKPGLLILDNLQEVPDQGLVYRVLLEGLSRIPKGLNVAIISRRDPPPSFSRLISKRKLTTIGWDELRLKREEFIKAARSLGGVELDEELILKLHAKLEGWIAGLVLALEQRRHDGPDSTSLPTGDLQSILNYFVSEIWDRARSEVREFLLQTSFLQTFNPEMAEKLTGINRADRILSNLCDHNLFTFRLAGESSRYRYHTLFRKFLRVKARETMSEDRFAKLMQKTVTVLKENDQYHAAAELYVESGDWERLCRLIRQRAQHLIRTGRSETLNRLLSVLPEDCLTEDPWLMYWKGICAMQQNQSVAKMFLTRAHEVFSRREDLPGMWMSWADLVSCLIYYWGDMQEVQVRIDRFKQMHEKYGGFPSSEVETHVLPAVLYSYLNARPYPQEISVWIERTKTLLQNSRDIGQSWRLFGPFLNYLLRAGRIQEAKTYLSYLLPKMDDPDQLPFFRIWNRSLTSLFQFIAGETKAGVRTVEIGLEEAERTGIRGLDGILSTRAVYCSLSDADLSIAEKYLGRCHRDLDPGNMLHRTHLLYLDGWLALCQGDNDRAQYLMMECHRSSLETGSPFFIAIGRLGMVHVMIEQGMFEEARQQLSKVILEARRMDSKHLLHQIHMVLAWLYLNTGEKGKLNWNLRRFFSVGRVNHLFNFSLWRPAVISRLCAAALDADIETEYVGKLIRRRGLVPDSASHRVEKWPWAFKIYTLGRFEIMRDAEPVRFTGKVQQKPLDLLKALIAYGGRRVSAEKLMDTLWPESEGDAAQRAFDITLHRLRKWMGNGKAILLKDGKLSLDPEQCWVDIWSFERLVGAAESDMPSTSNSDVFRALATFRGLFLPNDESKAWTVPLRERTWSKYLRLVEKLGTEFESSGESDQAVDLYLKALERNDKQESLHLKLMVCYERIGQKSEALAAYRRCQRTLSAALGIEPNSETKALYDRINSSPSA
jgi:ATP/maltotriose-dependent transcriptional regulator MalT/DNA-binding SARP family transcriptional activator